MKKMIILTLLQVYAGTIFSQQIDYSHSLNKQEYLRKSKNQKTIAWILLSGGFVLSTAGAMIAVTEVTVQAVGVLLSGSVAEEPKNSNVSGILFYTGLASMVGSIPLFSAASRNKKSAALISASIKIEESSLVLQSTLTRIQFPAIGVKINL